MGSWTIILVVLGILQVSSSASTWGGLYPRESMSREVKSLDGLWNFRLSPLQDPDQGFREEWFSRPLSQTGQVISMAVPSSYNDVTQDKALRDHIGWAWYDRTFIVPARWEDDHLRVVLRLGSAHYNSNIYLNGVLMTSHEGGHLPVMADITSHLVYGNENLLTVAINNTLTPHTIPQGSIVYKNDPTRYPPGYFVQEYNFDFTNYAGIHRPVYIYTTPQTYVDDIVITTDIDGTDGIINYNITYSTAKMGPNKVKAVGCSIKLLNKTGGHVQSAMGCVGTIKVTNATFWWPYLMSEDPGYQYTMMVAVSDEQGNLDMYPQKIGIRTIGWNSTTLTINDVPMYLRGCGRHEDSDIRGKGVDYPLIIKDFSLLKWLGANSFRTSHYPYAEEIMDMADQEGIMIIDESPAVGLSGFDEALMNTHISVMQELVRRDKNRPSVIMWSVGNEPVSSQAAAKDYFSNVVNATKAADPSQRPVACVLSADKSSDKAGSTYLSALLSNDNRSPELSASHQAKRAVVGATQTADASRPVTCVLNRGLLSDFAASSLDVILVNRYYSWYTDTGHLEIIRQQTVTEFTEWHALHNKPVMISEYGAGSIAGFHQDPSFTWTEEYQAELMMNNFKAFDDLRNKGFFVGEMIWNFADFATPMEYNRPGACMKGLFTRQRQPKLAGHLMRYRYWSLANKLENATMPEGIHNAWNGFI